MTNNWTDIGNSTLVVAMGANPAENHPACMAHINVARKGPQDWTDPAGNIRRSEKRAAKLIVIDPRMTRTASYADTYVRIRPGTNIAFTNGVIRYILNDMAVNPGTPRAVNWAAYMNENSARTFLDDNTLAATTPVPGAGKYTDARFLLRADNADYDRETKMVGATKFSDFPKRSGSFTDAGTVFSKLKAHVWPYDPATVAEICGCTPDQLAEVAEAFMDNSRFAQTPTAGTMNYTFPAAPATVQLPTFGGTVTAVVVKSAGTPLTVTMDFTWTAAGVVTSVALGALAAGGAVTIEYTYTGIVSDPRSQDFRATTMLYAMGVTQFTHASSAIKDFANLQTLLGNMGRPGGGINALRGIHNVQGSTDMGLLYAYIPGYSGPPSAGQTFADYVNKLYGAKKPMRYNAATVTVDCTNPNADLVFTAAYRGPDGDAITIRYVDPGAETATESVVVTGNAIVVTLRSVGGTLSTAAMVKAAVDGTPAAAALVTVANAAANNGTGIVNAVGPLGLTGGSVMDESTAYTFGNLGLQAAGFYNMHKAWFMPADDTLMPKNQTNIAGTFELWPREKGDDHITMFRKMGLGTIKAAVIWGQNPAVTEPNQGSVRAGLTNLDTMVCVENFATETVMCDRKSDGVTYLIPSCGYVEEAGSVTNSGRGLQWRERATMPKGNSKADLELLLRFAKALNDNVTGGSAFKHIKDKWGVLLAPTAAPDVWTTLYGDQYCCGWDGTVDATHSFETTASLSGVESWPALASSPTTGTATGSEAVAEKIFREYAGAQVAGGSVWLYLEGYENGYRSASWTPTTASPTKSDLGANVTTGTLTVSPGTHTVGIDYSVDLATGSITALAGGNLIDNGAFTVTFQRDAAWKDSRGAGWAVYNRAKSRNNIDADTYGGGKRMFKNWGYCWLVNRRVLYNNGDGPWDQADGFQGPDQVSRLFVSTNEGLIQYSTNYRTIHTMADLPDNCITNKADLEVAATAGNNGLVYEAYNAGQGGNLISVQLVDPGTDTATETVTVKTTVRGKAVKVVLRSATGVLSTAAEVKAAIEASTSPATKVLHVHFPTGQADGTGNVVAMAPTFLSMAGVPAIPAPHVAPGRFPAHCEPYETPQNAGTGSANYASYWGRNTKGTAKWDLLPGSTYSQTSVYATDVTPASGRTSTIPAEIVTAAAANSAAFPDIAAPLVLTTIRCVEHFQGGPITRNNSWNVEAEPHPWIEINSLDARSRGIKDGDWINVVTVRGNSTSTQKALSPGGSYTNDTSNPTDKFGKGFKARVGVGLQPNQRVGKGVVAIPWHWGDQGLSTGSRANDLCIDAADANTVIPEYKACICWITKA